MKGLKASIHLFEPKHFVMPFLAHALGTLVGGLVAAAIAANSKVKMALIVGLLFFVGGVINIVNLPSPVWFTLLDLGVAYFPMAYFGARLAIRKSLSE